MNQQDVHKYLLSFRKAKRDYPFGKNIAVYYYDSKEFNSDNMFAVLEENRSPVRISLRCDPQLSKILREKYEEVMPGVNLNNNEWNTLVLTGQLENDDVKGLIRHSYHLVNPDS